MDKFPKSAHFIPFQKTINASHIVKLYFKEIVCLHGEPKSKNFISTIWKFIGI